MRKSTVIIGLGLSAAGLLAVTGPAKAAEIVSTAVGRLPKGLRNNNPGNLRYLPPTRAWDGQTGDDGSGYGVYASPAKGTRAAGKQLLKYYAEGLNTVRAIIATWAPTTENNTAAYVKAVSEELNLSPVQPFNVRERLPDVARAIFRHECGRAALDGYKDATGAQIYSYANISRWVYS